MRMSARLNIHCVDQGALSGACLWKNHEGILSVSAWHCTCLPRNGRLSISPICLFLFLFLSLCFCLAPCLSVCLSFTIGRPPAHQSAHNPFSGRRRPSSHSRPRRTFDRGRPWMRRCCCYCLCLFSLSFFVRCSVTSLACGRRCRKAASGRREKWEET